MMHISTSKLWLAASTTVLVAVITAWLIGHWRGPSSATSSPSWVNEDDDYVWPWRHDYLEDLYSLKTGYVTNLFSDGDSSTGRQTAAEWVRIAFHDAIPHSASSGQDGLDASIVFELDHAGNANTRPALESTLHFLSLFHSLRASVADLLALAVYVSVANCGGPRIPFRAGRVDATEAGSGGTPMPEQDFDVHKAMFARAGFSTADMITLVACGHTLGGVHAANFPNIVEGTHEYSVTHFDSSPSSFDNAVVLEYLSSTSFNPLVHSSNISTTSDRRIFSADSNATMKDLAVPSTYHSRCAHVLGKLLDTVPRHVALSRPLEPIDVKPYIREHALGPGGEIRLSGRIRVRVGANVNRSSENLQVKLVLRDRTGSTGRVVDAVRGKRDGGISLGHFGDEFAWFEFSTAVPGSVGMSSFNVHLNTTILNDQVVGEVHNNGGRGFPIPDALLYQPRHSCLDSTVRNGTMHLRVVCAVRQDSDSVQPPRLDMTLKTPRPGVLVPSLHVVSHPFRPLPQKCADGLYKFYSVETDVPVASWNTRFDVVGDKGARVEFLPTNILRSGSVCQELPS